MWLLTLRQKTAFPLLLYNTTCVLVCIPTAGVVKIELKRDLSVCRKLMDSRLLLMSHFQLLVKVHSDTSRSGCNEKMVDRLRGKCCSFLVLLDGTVTLGACFKCNIIIPLLLYTSTVENFFSAETFPTIIKTDYFFLIYSS